MTTLSSAKTLPVAIRSIRLKYARVGIRASCSLVTSISSVWRIDRRALDRCADGNLTFGTCAEGRLKGRKGRSYAHPHRRNSLSIA
jgi:hypothetical protein